MITARQHLETVLRKFVASDIPETLCINGPWGVGKTHAWTTHFKTVCDEQPEKVPRYAYVSLFGVNSLEAFKMAIFASTVQIPQKPEGIWKIKWLYASKYFCFRVWRYIKEFRFAVEGVPFGVGSTLAKAGPLWFATVRNVLICIDDLERIGSGLNVKDVLGLVSVLKEQRNCKVVLLLNDEMLPEAGKIELDVSLEKVVDSKLTFAPTTVENLNVVLVKKDQVSLLLRQDFIDLKINNIRVIQKIERWANELAPMLIGFHANVLHQSIHSLVLLGWSKLQPNITPSLEYLRKVGHEKLEGFPDWDLMTASYGFVQFDELDAVILDGIQHGIFNSLAVAAEAKRNHDIFVLRDEDNSFSEAWDRFHDSIEDNEDEVIEGLFSALQSSVQSVTPTNLDATVVLFRQLARNEQADLLISYYIDNHVATDNFWNLAQYNFPIRDPAVSSAFSRKFAVIRQSETIGDVLLRIQETKACTRTDLRTLDAVSLEDMKDVFRSFRGKDLANAIKATKVIPNQHEMPEAERVEDKCKDALVQIASESRINALRLERYGIYI